MEQKRLAREEAANVVRGSPSGDSFASIGPENRLSDQLSIRSDHPSRHRFSLSSGREGDKVTENRFNYLKDCYMTKLQLNVCINFNLKNIQFHYLVNSLISICITGNTFINCVKVILLILKKNRKFTIVL